MLLLVLPAVLPAVPLAAGVKGAKRTPVWMKTRTDARIDEFGNPVGLTCAYIVSFSCVIP